MSACTRPLRQVALLALLTVAASLAVTIAAPTRADAAPTDYVEMSDGAFIAINVKVPPQCTQAAPCATVLEMSGYESGSDEGLTPSGDLNEMSGGKLGFLPLQTGTRASHSVMFDDRFVTVTASVRGTGCSTGEFDLFSWRSALDGRELIDDWISQQPWSNGDVAIFGHSYSGITGTMIAATRPRHLRVASVSGLIDDLYRGIVYPGGITNYGFPLLWTGAVRPAYDVGGGVGGGVFPETVTEGDTRCAEMQPSKSRTTLNDPLIQGLADTDNEWFRSRSLINLVERITVPTHITGAYQDEQTGPRGPTHLFEQLPTTISKRLVVTNGSHGTQTDGTIRKDRVAWIDYFLGGASRSPAFSRPLREVFGRRSKPTTTARVLLGYHDGTFEGIVDSDRYPLKQTRWTDLYFSDGGELTFDRSAIAAGAATWVNGSRRQAYSYQAGHEQGGEISSPTGPDELEFAHEFATDTIIAGPITATLNVASSAPDTELFVQLIDRAPTGELLYLQRGMLKASHRAISDGLSDKTASGRIYRPWRPHTNPTNVTPGDTVTYLVEIFPVGHVFRAGHELVVKVHAPPLDDNDYAYVQKTLPGANTLHFSQEQPSSLMLPVIPRSGLAGGLRPAPADPCAYVNMRCVRP